MNGPFTDEQTATGLETHCGMCHAPRGVPCRPVAPGGVLTAPMHCERVTATMHKRRNG